MQTFLPYPNIYKSAQCLDWRRLGKQRVEAYQILNALVEPTYGWQNHPAVNMWRGYEWALVKYGRAVCNEWIGRGYRDTMLDRISSFAEGCLPELPIMVSSVPYPLWFGSEGFHSSHRAALLAKDYDWYKQWEWTERPKIDYWWPIKENKNEQQI